MLEAHAIDALLAVALDKQPKGSDEGLQVALLRACIFSLGNLVHPFVAAGDALSLKPPNFFALHPSAL